MSLPSIPSNIASWSHVCRRGLVFMDLFSAGLNPIYHLIFSISSVTAIYLIHLPVVFLKALSLVLYSLSHAQPHLVLSSPLFPPTTPLCKWHSTFLLLSSTRLYLSITHLQNALQQISSWMTANLLTLNTSETEYLLTGPSKRLTIILNSSLETTHSAVKLGFIFDEHLTFSDQISSLSK